MIVLRTKLNNVFGFDDFEINFSYPKRILNSLIEEEHLGERPNFRYAVLDAVDRFTPDFKSSGIRCIYFENRPVNKKQQTGTAENENRKFTISFRKTTSPSRCHSFF